MGAKSHVCWDIDLGGVLEGFWGGFGKPKSSLFAFFDVFSKSFLKRVSDKQTIEQKTGKKVEEANFGAGFRWSPASQGEIIERGNAKFSKEMSRLTHC